MINCLPKLVKHISDDGSGSILRIIKHMENYKGYDWKEYIRFDKLNTHSTMSLLKDKRFELQLIGLDKRYFYQSEKLNFIKVLENDVRISEKHEINQYSDFVGTTIITSKYNIYQLTPYKVMTPKSDVTGTLHLIVLCNKIDSNIMIQKS